MAQSPKPILNPNLAQAELCRRYLSEFVKEFWDEVVADPLVWAPHMTVLCDEIQAVYERIFLRYNDNGEPIGRLPKLYDLVINVPPGTSKSTIASQMAQAWGWARDPTLRHITTSYNIDLATGHSEKCRDLVESEKYQAFFPNVVIRDDARGKRDYKTTRLGQRKTGSTDSGITGIHAHLVTIDDPLNTQQAVSKAEITAAVKYCIGTLSTRKVSKDNTPTILIMQRLATNDPAGAYLELRKGGLKVRHVNLPGELDAGVSPKVYRDIYTDGLLDPVRLGVPALAELKLKLGSNGYAGQVQQRPVPEGGLIWQKWFIEIPDEAFPSRAVLTRLGTDWDLAYTKEDANAASAYITAGVMNGRIYIDDLGWDWLEFPKLIRWMKTRTGPHYIEAKASGKSSKQTLTNQGVVAIEVPVKGGADKVARANMSTPVAEAGMVCVRKSLADRLYNDSLQGILYFPNGPRADLADVLAQSIQRLSNGGTLVVAQPTEGTDGVPEDLDELGY